MYRRDGYERGPMLFRDSPGWRLAGALALLIIAGAVVFFAWPTDTRPDRSAAVGAPVETTGAGARPLPLPPPSNRQ